MLREEREEYIKNALDWLRGAAYQGQPDYHTLQMASQANSGNLRKIVKEGELEGRSQADEWFGQGTPGTAK
jgi:hypothetical protein